MLSAEGHHQVCHPFKQAIDASKVFYRKLSQLVPQYRKVPVVHLCIFPNAFFVLQSNMSVNPWEIMDCRSFRSFTSASDFCNELKVRMNKSIDSDGNISRMNLSLETKAVQEIVQCCLPIYTHHPNKRFIINLRQQEIDQNLRQQQKPVFQLSETNDRIIVDGGAGTGKSYIAMELARRKAETGERVALLCFNQLFGHWVEERMAQIEPQLPNLVVGRAIQVLMEMAGIVLPNNPDTKYWDFELPALIEEKMTDPEFHAIANFDYLVIDEAQDILARPMIWSCLLQFLNGGLVNGKFALLGDFEHQVLASRENLYRSLEQLTLNARPAKWNLKENCRNYRIVGKASVGLSGLDEKIYSGFMRQGGGSVNFDIRFYATDKEQADILLEWLRYFKAEGYRPYEITLLSFSSPEKSIAVSPFLKDYQLNPIWKHGAGIHYGSVHAFKGLENKIIILTDVCLNKSDFQRDLFYTGITRSTESVRIISDIASQPILFDWLTKKGGDDD